jgi:hypothetical protein
MQTKEVRASKYEKKITGDSQKTRTQAYGKQQAANFTNYVASAAKIEGEIKQMIGGKAPLSAINLYIIFAKQVIKLKGKYTNETLYGEMKILQDLWEGRGLDGMLLEGIKLYYVPQYPYINFFRCDVSDLDGTDVLA